MALYVIVVSQSIDGWTFSLIFTFQGQAIWAPTRENLSSEIFEQHRRRPACASAQSDQRLCYLLIEKYHI